MSAGDPIINFAGERVALGPMPPAYLPLNSRWINDFSAARNVGYVEPETYEQHDRRWARRLNDPRRIAFVVYELTTLQPIGRTGLNSIDERNSTAEFGIQIAREEHGKGYGTETTRLILDYAFTVRGLRSVLLTVVEFNVAGRRAYERAGFREIGRRRQSFRMAGRRWDDICMECLASEFESPVLRHALASE